MEDNLELTVRVREMRQDDRDKSVHFFHHYALKDRVDSSHLSSYQPQCLASSLCPADFLPSAEDYRILRNNFVIHLARIAVKKLTSFRFLQEGVPQHIHHPHSKDLSQPSQFVSG